MIGIPWKLSERGSDADQSMLFVQTMSLDLLKAVAPSWIRMQIDRQNQQQSKLFVGADRIGAKNTDQGFSVLKRGRHAMDDFTVREDFAGNGESGIICREVTVWSRHEERGKPYERDAERSGVRAMNAHG